MGRWSGSDDSASDITFRVLVDVLNLTTSSSSLDTSSSALRLTGAARIKKKNQRDRVKRTKVELCWLGCFRRPLCLSALAAAFRDRDHALLNRPRLACL
jgi:hypothetical protein